MTSSAEPATLPRYRSLVLLGRGGMGSVEAAIEHGDDTSRVVALKRILRAEGSDPRRVEMFLREARLTTLLDHPNVVRALSYGECSGELFLAMEYIAGEPLSRLVSLTTDQGDLLPPPVVAYILAEACEGLHAAHELQDKDGEPLNVVHRDISPHNVMVAFDGSVKLLDFGVAKIEALESAGRTKTGEVKGKTAYMSPEQAMGEAIDRRSDLYSMGAVLFECLTGRRMWGVGTDLEVLRRLALDEPPSLASAAANVPPELARLHAKLIERDREARPATARAVATELRAYISSSGTEVDAELLRATMARLFNDEREQRESAILEALAVAQSEANDGAGPASESGPQFTTDAGIVSQVPTRRSSRAIASGAALLLAVAAFGLALWHRDGGRVAAAPELSMSPSPAHVANAASVTPSARATSAGASATPLGASPPAPPASEAAVLPAPAVLPARPSLRGTNQTPTPRPSSAARRDPKPADSAASSHPPLNPPEPLDVDPTPF